MSGRKKMSEEQKSKLSENWHGRKNWINGVMPNKVFYDHLFAVKKKRVKREWFDKFEDSRRFRYLNKYWNNRNKREIRGDTEYCQFIEKYYDDPSFIKYYNLFKETKDKWYMPSFDHVISKSNGGVSLGIDNMVVISWFENRAKCDIDQDVWSVMKKNIRFYIDLNNKNDVVVETNKDGLYDDIMLDNYHMVKKTDNSAKYRNRKSVIRNMVSHLRYSVTDDWVDSFHNLEKVKYLNKMIHRERDSKGFTSELYKRYVEKFYYDKDFNYLFDNWVASGDRWIKPSLDHIVPRSKGCSITDIDNLRFISNFENRAKVDMDECYWNDMKNRIESYLNYED